MECLNKSKINLLKVDINGFDFYFSEVFKEVLYSNDNKIDSDILRYIEYGITNFDVNFRLPVEIKSLQLLLTFNLSEKRITLFSSRLNTELAYIGFLEKNDSPADEVLKLINGDDYKLLRELVLESASMSPDEFPTTIKHITQKFNLVDFTDNNNIIDSSKSYNSEYNHNLETLLDKIKEYRPTMFERISDYGLSLTAQYSLLRIHLLKFLAILPSLDHDLKGNEVKKNLEESFRRLIDDNQRAIVLNLKGEQKPLPNSLRWSFKVLAMIISVIPEKPLSKLVRSTVKTLARRFIAGENISLAEKSFKSLMQSGRDVTVDQLGELVVSEKEADHYLNEVLNLIKGFDKHYAPGTRNTAGILCAHVSIKVSALCSNFKPHAFDYTYNLVAPRLKKILLEAKKHQVFIHIDAEHFSYRDLVFNIYKKVLLEEAEFSDYKDTGIVIQAYLRDAYVHFQDVLGLAKSRNLPMPIRLVKGAYWDAETIEADAHSFIAPQFINKEETDLHFRQLVNETLKNSPHLQLCIASHNFSDHCYAQSLRSAIYPDALEIEHQCLHMTYEALSVALAKMNWAVRNYVPIGSLIVGMAYLVRRIMENSSQVGVLTIMRSHNKKANLVSPAQVLHDNIQENLINRDLLESSMTASFFNVAPLKLYITNHLTYLLNQFNQFKAGTKFDSILSGQETKIFSPSDPSLLVGSINFATIEEVNSSLNVLKEDFSTGKWANLHYSTRSLCLIKAASIMQVKRADLSALIVHESGKTFPEALADVDEAIDFLNFYAREEERVHRYNDDCKPRGVVAVIAPWNFPLAIPCGMVSSALIAGNSVCLKSSEQTPLIAQVLINILYQAGVPKSSLIHLPGHGHDVGEAIVQSPKVSTYVFTGSKKIGCHIYSTASQRMYTNPLTLDQYPTKVIAEMGGKNAVIVTANAELDETVDGILYSAFAHSGQKCSAASRIIVDNRVKDRLIERLTQAANDLKIDKSSNLATMINPLISEREKIRLHNQAKLIQDEINTFGGKVHLNKISHLKNGKPLGNCVGPMIIELPTTRSFDKESFGQIELFAPVVHIIGFNDLDQALEIFNATEYALTGGIFSQSQDDIDYLSEYMECGNLYINRSITGARVAIEPFGGFKMSGTGPKAGSKSYLSSFHYYPPKEEKIDVIEETGNDYQFKLSTLSLLNDSQRAQKVETIFSSIIREFEYLFQGIYTQEKESLINFRKWCRKNLEFFNKQEHYNRIIPGQLNFDKYQLRVENVVYIEYAGNGNIQLFFYVLAAVVQGVGVTVICRNESGFSWWNKVLNILYSCGISKQNFDVFFSSEEVTYQTCKQVALTKIIVSGDISKVEKISKVINFNPQLDSDINNPSSEMKHLKKIVSIYDLIDTNNYRGLLEQFIFKKSYAVNIMRYGAPMSLEKEVVIGPGI